MLKGNINKPDILEINGFLVAVEISKDTITADEIANRLADSLSFMEGTGQIEVSHLGILELVPEESEGAMQVFGGDESTTTIKES